MFNQNVKQYTNITDCFSICRPTVVHKFIIQNTIEYSIHQATSSNAENWDKNKITLNLLKGLFIDPEGEDNSDEVSQAEPTEM